MSKKETAEVIFTMAVLVYPDITGSPSLFTLCYLGALTYGNSMFTKGFC